MNVINGKELKSFKYADGVHYFWGDREVAVINEKTAEIEWCDRIRTFPEEVVTVIRALQHTEVGKWVVRVRRITSSETQGYFTVSVNGNDVLTFGDDKQIGLDGKWHSKYSDAELGKILCAALWHPKDDIYHYSDKMREAFIT